MSSRKISKILVNSCYIFSIFFSFDEKRFPPRNFLRIKNSRWYLMFYLFQENESIKYLSLPPGSIHCSNYTPFILVYIVVNPCINRRTKSDIFFGSIIAQTDSIELSFYNLIANVFVCSYVDLVKMAIASSIARIFKHRSSNSIRNYTRDYFYHIYCCNNFCESNTWTSSSSI